MMLRISQVVIIWYLLLLLLLGFELQLYFARSRLTLREWREKEKDLYALNPYIQGEKILGLVYLLLIRCDQRFAGTSCLVAVN